MMPEMDGLELVTRLKRTPELSRIPIILVTAKTSREDIVIGLEAGAEDYLGKPFGPPELKARVRAAHRLHRAISDLESALTSLRQSQQQLVQASKMAAVGTMIAGLSHELNNPLAIIAINAQQLMKMPCMDAPAATRALTRIRTQTERCTHLVRSLLDYSRRSQPILEPILPKKLLGQVAQLATPWAQGRAVDIVLAGDWAELEGIELRGCVHEIETALLNLVNNAVGATPAGGWIAMRARAAASDGRPGVEITVSDTGHGIAAEVLPRIFDPFFTTKAPGEGTGLGLSITRQIVESHRGKIEVESQEGHGTSVQMWLPAEGS
jgi:signal transduction histidine kinase